MESEVGLQVEGLLGNEDVADKIIGIIQQMPGIEFVVADTGRGTVRVTGGDLDQLTIEDAIEGLGYPVLR